MDKLVTIASFERSTEAHMAKTMLEEQGIEVFVGDDNLVNWYLSSAVGGVKIQVPELQAERATKLLEEIRQNTPEKSQQSNNSKNIVVCEECGKELSVPGDRSGHVETCPHCGKYIDVP